MACLQEALRLCSILILPLLNTETGYKLGFDVERIYLQQQQQEKAEKDQDGDTVAKTKTTKTIIGGINPNFMTVGLGSLGVIGGDKKKQAQFQDDHGE